MHVKISCFANLNLVPFFLLAVAVVIAYADAFHSYMKAVDLYPEKGTYKILSCSILTCLRLCVRACLFVFLMNNKAILE